MSLFNVFFIAMVVSGIATWLCRRLALRYGIVDRPDQHVKTHATPVAYLGGLAILVGLIVGSCSVWKHIPTDEQVTWFAVGLGAVLVCLVGLIDDLFDIKPRYKILGQLFAATALIHTDFIPPLCSSLSEGWVAWGCWGGEVLIVYGVVLGSTNSLNLLDGLDGLCVGVTWIIGLAFLLIAAIATESLLFVVCCLALLGALTGFYPFNRQPARIFMGDAGSLLLGFMVAVFILSCIRCVDYGIGVAGVIVGFPCLDTSVAIIRRFLNQQPLFQADRGHLYDQWMDRGLSVQQSVNLSYACTGVYALLGLCMIRLPVIYASLCFGLSIVLSGLLMIQGRYFQMEGKNVGQSRPCTSPTLPSHQSVATK